MEVVVKYVDDWNMVHTLYKKLLALYPQSFRESGLGSLWSKPSVTITTDREDNLPAVSLCYRFSLRPPLESFENTYSFSWKETS